MLASGVAVIAPSSASASPMRWSSSRYSGKLAMIRPAREMSRVSTRTPAVDAYAWITGQERIRRQGRGLVGVRVDDGRVRQPCSASSWGRTRIALVRLPGDHSHLGGRNPAPRLRAGTRIASCAFIVSRTESKKWRTPVAGPGEWPPKPGPLAWRQPDLPASTNVHPGGGLAARTSAVLTMQVTTDFGGGQRSTQGRDRPEGSGREGGRVGSYVLGFDVDRPEPGGVVGGKGATPRGALADSRESWCRPASA